MAVTQRWVLYEDLFAQNKTEKGSVGEGSHNYLERELTTYLPLTICHQIIESILQKAGYTKSDSVDKANVVLLNTCAIR